MKPWKFLALIAFLVGIAGMVLPLVVVKRGVIKLGFSAKELTFGMDRTHALLDAKIPKFAEKRMSADVREARDDARLVAEASRGAAVAFVPAALLGVIGVLAHLRRRFGRFFGLLSVLLGLCSLGAFFGLRYAVAYALEEIALQKTTIALHTGAWALVAIGALGLLAGLGALRSPDTGLVTTPKPRR